MTKEHFENLYKQLYDLFVECKNQGDETYQQKIGMILDHMIYNQPHLYLTNDHSDSSQTTVS